MKWKIFPYKHSNMVKSILIQMKNMLIELFFLLFWEISKMVFSECYVEIIHSLHSSLRFYSSDIFYLYFVNNCSKLISISFQIDPISTIRKRKMQQDITEFLTKRIKVTPSIKKTELISWYWADEAFLFGFSTLSRCWGHRFPKLRKSAKSIIWTT